MPLVCMVILALALSVPIVVLVIAKLPMLAELTATYTGTPPAVTPSLSRSSPVLAL